MCAPDPFWGASSCVAAHLASVISRTISGTLPSFNLLIRGERLSFAHGWPTKDMNGKIKSIARTGVLRSSQRFSRAGMLWVWVGAAILFGLNVRRFCA